METRKLRAFLKAVRYKSFTRAAAECDYTPSAFSHMAHALNEELGICLFRRTPSGIELTEEGDALYGKLSAVIEAEDALREAASVLSQSTRGELRIACYASISRCLLPSLLKRFRERHPDIHVSVTVSAYLRGLLSEGVCDVILGDRQASGAHAFLPLQNDPFVAVVREDAFVGREEIHIEELYRYPFLSTNETLLRSVLDESRFTEILPIEAEDDEAVIAMVREGIGVAILPRLAVKAEAKGVRTLALRPSIHRTLVCAYQRKPTASVATFIRFLKENFADAKL